MKKLNIILGIIIIFTSCKTKVEKNDCNENLSNLTGSNFEIYNEVFSDSTNFPLYGEDKFSDVKYLIDSSTEWDIKRFVVTQKERSDAYSDEHSPYNHTYLFNELENLVSEEEKANLSCIAKNIKRTKIGTSINEFKKISRYQKFTGFCLELTQPIYSEDKNLVFIDMFIHKNDDLRPLDTLTYYSKVGFIYEKQDNGNWKQKDKKGWIML